MPYTKLTPDTRDTLIDGFPESVGQKILAQVDAAEAQNLRRYCLVGKNFCFYIRDGQISGSISRGVGNREINGFITGIEAIDGPVQRFPVN